MVSKRITKSNAGKATPKLRAVPPKTRKPSMAARMSKADPHAMAEGMTKLAIELYGDAFDNLSKR